MKTTITNDVKGCSLCQSRKNNPTNPKPPLFPIPSDSYTLPFTSIALDFIVKLPQSNHYDTILTIMDMFSKASIFIPCNETIDSEHTASLYATYVLPHYGLPSRISPTKTHASPPPSHENSANSFTSNKTSALHTTPKQTVSQNVPTSGWNNTFASSATSTRTIGHTGYCWHSTYTTLGQIRRQRKPLSGLSWVTHQGSINQPDSQKAHQLTTDSNKSRSYDNKQKTRLDKLRNC